MFRKLSYSVTFPTTGRTLSADLTFTKGFWVISGPNESGKSMVFEMMRFLLFGTAALRGDSEHYKTLTVSGELDIRGETYTASRTMRKAEVSRGDEVLATGVTAVNAKFVELLGFGITVFDMANSINQGEVERLGAMKPTERKKLIDDVIGINALDVVAKWGMDEARVLSSNAAAIRATLIAPIKPAQPTNYKLSSDLLVEVAALRAQRDELVQVQGFLSVTRTAPRRPQCAVELPSENLRMFAEKRATLRNTIADLKARIGALPETAPCNELQLADAEAEWARWDVSQEARRKLQTMVEPKYTISQLNDFQALHIVIDLMNHRDQLNAQINVLKDKGSRPCPHCGEDIPLEADAIDRLIDQRDTLDIPDMIVTVPPLSMKEIVEAERALNQWDQEAFNRATHEAGIGPASPPSILRERIASLRAAISQVVERQDLVIRLTAAEGQFSGMPDYEAMLAERVAFEKALPIYQAESLDYERWNAERQQKTVRLTALQDVPSKLEAAEGLLHLCRAYEADLARFQAAKDQYDTHLKSAEDAENKAKEFRKVRDVMVLLRSLIKQHLLPSLNKVASHLLTGMTGGQRTRVEVDEEFNVNIDQQPLDTLSGSGKAVANLALRIALGQVLTNKVISILLADEIDGSMDDFRAEQTADVLRTLDNNVSQVLLVSHKSIEAKNEIHLGGFIDQSIDLSIKSEGDL